MYNVLKKLCTGEPLSAKEQAIHEQGLVSVLKQIHDELAAAVFDAYGSERPIVCLRSLRGRSRSEREGRELERRGLSPPSFDEDGADKTAGVNPAAL
ncbi:MAG: hypothetical protein WEB58_12560 [Planctomycetaceae bacterium]